jgi:hypothetical protein
VQRIFLAFVTLAFTVAADLREASAQPAASEEPYVCISQRLRILAYFTTNEGDIGPLIEGLRKLGCNTKFVKRPEPYYCGDFRIHILHLYTVGEAGRVGPIVEAMNLIGCQTTYTDEPEPSQCNDFRTYVVHFFSIGQPQEAGAVLNTMNDVGCKPSR